MTNKIGRITGPARIGSIDTARGVGIGRAMEIQGTQGIAERKPDKGEQPGSRQGQKGTGFITTQTFSK